VVPVLVVAGGWMAGKNPLTVPPLMIASARSRSNLAASGPRSRPSDHSGLHDALQAVPPGGPASAPAPLQALTS